MPQFDSDLDLHSLALHSDSLKQCIREQIDKQHDISFAQFMQMALYQPGLGYYSSGMYKFGAQGDFVTAPELGSLFAQCMAKQFQQVINAIDSAVILELGAGTGQFCYDCLVELDKLNSLPKKYYILEVSADLKHRQQQKIDLLPVNLQTLVTWIEKPLERTFDGIIFANEVIDALAVEVFKYENNQYLQMRVKWNNGFKQCWGKFSDRLNTEIKDKNLNLSEGYVSEFSPHLTQWLASISKKLNKGTILFVDYGYDKQAYYHPQRNQGTLICYHRHQANFDYLDHVGLQDITAFVDFTALAQAADDCKLSIDGYSTQAHFLLSLGIQEKLGDSENNYKNYYKRTTEMKKLVMPNEMGEKFKVMALSKNFDDELMGFSFSNQLHLL